MGFTVLIPDSKVSRRFWDFWKSGYLGEGIGRLLESCSYDPLANFREQSLETDISVLFSEGLWSVMGYDTALNERLKREQNRSFAWMLPLSLCNTFESRYVSGAFIESVHRLVVEGFSKTPSREAD